MPFKSIQDFRDRATDDDYKVLESYIKKQKNRSAAFTDNPDYGFSYTAAAAELRAHGYLNEPKKSEEKKDSNAPLKFIIGEWHDKKFKSRSVQISEDIQERFDSLAHTYQQYSKKAILDVLLDEALKMYGF